MVNNVQTSTQFNVDVQLDQCTESAAACEHHIPVLTSSMIDYPACNVTLVNETRQPYYGKDVHNNSEANSDTSSRSTRITESGPTLSLDKSIKLDFSKITLISATCFSI